MIDVATPQKAVSSAMHAMPVEAVPDEMPSSPETLARVLPRAMALLPCRVCTQRIGNEPSVRHLSLYGVDDWSMACELWLSQLQYHACR